MALSSADFWSAEKGSAATAGWLAGKTVRLAARASAGINALRNVVRVVLAVIVRTFPVMLSSLTHVSAQM